MNKKAKLEDKEVKELKSGGNVLYDDVKIANVGKKCFHEFMMQLQGRSLFSDTCEASDDFKISEKTNCCRHFQACMFPDIIL